MRIVFMGSPALAVPSLRALIDAGHELPLVVTQPPHEAGRGHREVQPPVAQEAQARELPLFQPERLRRPEAVARVREAQPDVIVVAAFGQILPPSVLEIPHHGCINVHPSLLPRHRGAAPISAAILAGDAVTGVSIMLMDPGMDTGPVLSQAETPILDADDQVSLSTRLADLGAAHLVQTLDAWTHGQLTPAPQDNAQATITRLVTRADGALDWREPAAALWRRVRAYAEWPQGFTSWEGKQLRIRAAHPDGATDVEAGHVITWGPSARVSTSAAVGTGHGVLVLDIVGLEGRRLLPIAEFLRGQPRFVGSRLGDGSSDPVA